MPTQKLSIRIDAETKSRLDAVAAELNRSRSRVVNDALRQYLEHHAWMAEAVAGAVREADECGVFSSHEEVVGGIDAMIEDAEKR